MDRSQFTFYRSFYQAISRIKKRDTRCLAYDAICAYALTGEMPDIEALPDAAAIAFELIKPNLDSSRRKAESGKSGGASKKSESKTKAKSKQAKSKSEIENEVEGEKELEIEIENECYTHTRPKKWAVEFEQFWIAYPKKKSKGEAVKAFEKVMKSGVPVETLVTAIEAQKKTEDWKKENGQFIPYPATWLNKRCWEDEISASKPQGFVYDYGEYDCISV